MKLRRLPEDFQVQEQNALPVGSHGSFAVYELSKTGWTTLDAMSHFSRTLNIPRKQMSHAGLKDRHAITRQTITIRHGPRRNFTAENLSLTYRGQSPRATSPSDIVGNLFNLVLRSLTPAERQNLTGNLPGIQLGGILNYFDEQRFGSWYPSHGFVGEAWVRQNYELALWLTFAEHHPRDNAHEREQKAILRTYWKDWATCKQRLERSHRRSVVTFLCDKPEDFKGAWGIVNADLRGLSLSALQSSLWNELASAFLFRDLPAEDLFSVTLTTGTLLFPRRISAEQGKRLQAMQLPLPSARVRLEEEPEAAFMEETLRQRSWSFSELKVRFPRDRFFSRSRRPMMIPVNDLTTELAPDELEPGRSRALLRFSLPRGSYATMVIKALLYGADNPEGSSSIMEDDIDDSI